MISSQNGVARQTGTNVNNNNHNHRLTAWPIERKVDVLIPSQCHSLTN